MSLFLRFKLSHVSSNSTFWIQLLQLWMVRFENMQAFVVMVLRYACVFGIFLKLFCHFFLVLHLIIFSRNSIDGRYLVDASPPTVVESF